MFRAVETETASTTCPEDVRKDLTVAYTFLYSEVQDASGGVPSISLSPCPRGPGSAGTDPGLSFVKDLLTRSQKDDTYVITAVSRYEEWHTQMAEWWTSARSGA